MNYNYSLEAKMPFPTARNKEAILSLLSLPSSIPFLVILKKISSTLRTSENNLQKFRQFAYDVSHMDRADNTAEHQPLQDARDASS